MKTLILTLTLLVYSVSLFSQDYAVVLNSNTRSENEVVSNSQLAHFTSHVITYEKFKYRDFLNKSKKSNEIFQVEGQVYTKKDLVKLLRKGAIISKDSQQFQQFLIDTKLNLMNEFSDKELILLYEKLRKGSVTNYVQDLADNWN